MSESKNNKKKNSPLGEGPKMPKFNIYWIYGLIALSLFSARFFQMAPELTTTTEQEFKQVMLMRGDVERIDLVQNKEIVRVYIKVDSIQKDYYVQKFKKKLDKAKVKNIQDFLKPKIKEKVAERKYETILHRSLVSSIRRRSYANSRHSRRSDGKWHVYRRTVRARAGALRARMRKLPWR